MRRTRATRTVGIWSMTDNDSDLIRNFKAGDKAAADELIAKFYGRVVRAAKKRLEGVRIRAISEEDIAASVFESLWQRADEKRFAEDQLGSTEELWKLLCTLVRFKASDHIRREMAERRGGGEVQGESVFINKADEKRTGLANHAADDQSIGSLVGFQEQHQLLMKRLGSDDLREVATMRLEGQKVQEIAEHFDKSDRWVKRKLALIRNYWAEEMDQSE